MRLVWQSGKAKGNRISGPVRYDPNCIGQLGGINSLLAKPAWSTVEALTVKRPDRKHLRPITKTGLSEKQFKPAITELRKRVDLRNVVHPLFVVADLRRGSVARLDRYLAKHKGIPDHAVALELRKLISGSPCRSKFRLIVVQHPSTPIDVGGRQRVSNAALSVKEQQIVARYKELLAFEGKRYRAEEVVQEEFQLSRSTIKRALKKAEEIDRRETEKAKSAHQREASVQRREEALRRLRCQDGGRDS